MMLPYRHCRSIDGVVRGTVKGNPAFADAHFKKAYEWLEKQVGFYPLFVAVGNDDEALTMTGYKDQFRKNGNKRNDVLFSFEQLTGIYMDFRWWHIPLNASHTAQGISETEEKMIFKKSYSPGDWLRMANRNPGSVQLIVKELHLPHADKIQVRNGKTKKELEKIGFHDVETKRVYIREADRFI